MNRPYRVVATVKLALTSAAVELHTDQIGVVRLFSDRPFHFKVGAEATTEDAPVAADTPEYIADLATNESLTAILAEGETDGSIWASYIQFA